MFYQVANRSTTNQRLRFFKKGPTAVTFEGSQFPTYDENTIQFGWCMAPAKAPTFPIPGIVQEFMVITSYPIGINGSVSLYRDGVLQVTQRYTNLQSHAARKEWFNREFGSLVTLDDSYGQAMFSTRGVRAPNRIGLLFEDDDILYESEDFKVDSSNLNPTIAFPRYRSFALELIGAV